MSEHIAAAQAGGLVGGPRSYRKKPVVIEAVLFDGTMASAYAIIDWSVGAVVEHLPQGGDTLNGQLQMSIETLEGTMLADPGDYVIKGVENEFYPCKASVFAASYEPA